MILPEEKILSDDYLVFAGYYYLCDQVVEQSPTTGNVRELKQLLNCVEVRRCDIFGRLALAGQSNEDKNPLG